MKRLLFITTLFLFIGGAGLAFSGMFIVYSSGDCSVDLEGSGHWTEADFDMSLQNQSVIKTGADGVVEIEINGELISIGENRVVAIGDFIGKVDQKKKANFLKGLKKYTKRAGSKKGDYTETALAGVRGSAQEGDSLEWFEESDFVLGFEENYESGILMFNDGHYTAAIDIFHEIMNEHGDTILGGEVAFYHGLSLFHVMRFDEAVESLELSLTEKSSDFYEMALMHLSVSRYFLKHYDDAIEGFMTFAATEGSGELKPYALLMLGKCYREQGEVDEAEKFFTMVQNEYRGTEFSATAVEELQSLGTY
jgi:tetratricopeptide (TPR) repeat protein